MPRDYATRGKSRKKANTRTKSKTQKKPISPIIWVFTGMFITLFGLFLYALTQKPEYLKSFFASDVNNQKQEQVQTAQTTDNSAEELPLSYHKTLTTKEVAVEKELVNPTETNRRYIMQCAATKVLEKAEAMKAELAFLGFQSNISEKNGWYRIQLGPYTSKRAAESERHKLQDNNYDNCRIW